MLIRKNTKAFKTILEIFTTCQDRPDREELIRLYITKAGHTIKDRISVEAIEGDARLFYEMNYQAVLNNLKSSNHQLHHSDDIPGLYFFHSSSNKVWDETPFEFDEAIKKEFGALPDLPVTRKKEKVERFTLPAPQKKTQPKPIKNEKVERAKTIRIIEKGPKQPDYKLRHKILFTDLEKIVIRQAQLSKKGVLDYYNGVAEYVLPYLKDRPLRIRRHSQSAKTTYMSLEELLEGAEEVPDWIQKATVSRGKQQEQVFLCNDKEHLLFYVEMGCLEFHPSHSRTKSFGFPDYAVIGIESPEASMEKALVVAQALQSVLSGLELPSFIKTDGMSGLHVYVPLDAKSTGATCTQVAEYLCKLTRLKIPNQVTLKGSENFNYEKASLDYEVNRERNSIVAPYSLVAEGSATVATPISWEEVNDGLQPEDFNHETIFKRLKRSGDPFETLLKKKINADELLKRLEMYYSFLF